MFKGDSPKAPEPATVVVDNGQKLPGDGFPWLSDTPSSDLSWETHGR